MKMMMIGGCRFLFYYIIHNLRRADCSSRVPLVVASLKGSKVTAVVDAAAPSGTILRLAGSAVKVQIGRSLAQNGRANERTGGSGSGRR